MDGRGADVERLRAALVAAGLDADVDVDRVLAAALPSTRLVLTAAAISETASDRDPSPPGTSQFGGSPDRAPGSPWPTGPLTFVGQVALQALGGAGGLPDSGLLAFYYDVAAKPWDSTDGPGWWVEHLALDAAAGPVAAPDGIAVLTAATVDTFEELTLPYPRTAIARSLDLDGERWEAYCDAWDTIATEVRRPPIEDGRVHRLGGHPDAIQGDMTRRIVYGRAGVDLEQDDPVLEAEATEYRLLLQVDSDHEALGTDAVWANFGRLFFWITAGDLAAGRFDRCELQLQC